MCVVVCWGGGDGREGHPNFSKVVYWRRGLRQEGHATCRTEIQDGDFKITCNARWTLSHKTQDGRSFTVPRTFNFCLKWGCVSSTIPKGSTITKPPEVFRVDQNAQITPDEWRVINFMELPLLFD